MKISYNWLQNYLDLKITAEEAAEKLTLLGLEVEEITRTGINLDGIVVGKVLNVSDHPNADRLKLCRVDLGDREVQIVCGADNVKGGQKVPVAKTGAVLPVPLPDGSSLTIKKMKLRGETSEGMICAEDELGLGDDHSGIMVLNPDLKTGTPLRDALDIELDTVFEIGLTPNRPDAACHLGVARDLAAVLKKDIKSPYIFDFKETEALGDYIDIKIEDRDKCHRYTAKIVENVTVGESPVWLQNKLQAIGLRPINNVVDVTNYILHECGQPLHAFDYNLIAGKQIVVKSFNKAQKFRTLDDVERTVPEGSLFICDGKGPVAIAGVMGGESSEVSDETKTVLIESAWFNPSSIRKTSKALALQTDSSYRFERGVDPNLQRAAAERAAELIAELTGGNVPVGCSDIHPVKTDPNKVDLRTSRVNHLLGTEIRQKEAADILGRLGITAISTNNDVLTCAIPTFRPDIEREVDLIEEIGRIIDYNNIPVPDRVSFASPDPLSDWEIFNNRLIEIAKNLSFKEITTNSLLSGKESDLLSDEKEQIKTLNPVSSENTTLRTSLLGGFLKSLQYNLNRNADSIRFFESGHIYKYSNEGTWLNGILEHSHILLGVCGYKQKESWRNDPELYSLFDLKTELYAFFDELHILKEVVETQNGEGNLEYTLDDKQIGTLKEVPGYIANAFEVELPTFAAELDITVLYNLKVHQRTEQFTPASKFPPFEFDAAFTVDRSVKAGALQKTIQETAGKILKNVEVFDVYEGENLGKDKKSIAFRLTFLDRNKTLNIKDVEPIVQNIVKALGKNYGATLRS